jgi:hypothetical protein
MENKKKSVYIETTIPSYATSKVSSDIVIASRQFLTKRFFEEESQKYELYTSQYVIDECELGDPEAAKRRLDFISGMKILPKTDKISDLAKIYFNLLQIPERAKADCSHLAICVTTKLDYLLSWNCIHLGFNSYIKVVEYNTKHSLWIPLLITPDYLLDLTNEEEAL